MKEVWPHFILREDGGIEKVVPVLADDPALYAQAAIEANAEPERGLPYRVGQCFAAAVLALLAALALAPLAWLVINAWQWALS